MGPGLKHQAPGTLYCGDMDEKPEGDGGTNIAYLPTPNPRALFIAHPGREVGD